MPSPYQIARRVENGYAVTLRKLASTIDKLVRGIGAEAPPNVLRDTLWNYSQTIEPWAQAVAQRMVEDVNRSQARVWFNRAAEMGRLLREDEFHQIARQRQADQVELITSLPKEAGDRVMRLASEAQVKGTRASELAVDILRTGEVTKARANMIARTEVARTHTLLTQGRAESVGSEGYIWRTVHDADVRPSHKKMEGKFVRWDSPPTLDGMVGHAGCVPNCRCYADPVLPARREVA